ncbi:sigma-70 family RNA polymerase sigma factor [Candidatus Hydrogenedentota bacterium]
MKDGELIDRILGGNEQLFSQIVERYAGCVWGVCLSYVRNYDDCEDVVQETFVQCYRRLDSIRNRAAFGKWLSTLARRQSLQWIRTKSRRMAAMSRYAENVEMTRPTNGHDEILKKDLYGSIREQIDELSPKLREVFHLFYCEDMTIAETADFLGISKNAVKKRLEYGRKQLKQTIGKEVGPALGPHRHRKDLAGRVLAGVPFGNVPWLAKAGTGAVTASKVGLGGVLIMTKKLLIGLSIAVVVLLMAYMANESSREDAESVKVVEKSVSGNEIAAISPSSQVTQLEAGNEGLGDSDAVKDEPASDSSMSDTEEAQQVELELAKPAESVLPEQQGNETKFVSVSGLVMDQAGFAVPDAEIILEVHGHDVFKAATDARGQYTIDKIDAPGFAFVASAHAQAPGYVMGKVDNIMISTGKDKPNINFTLKKAEHFIEGRVVSNIGEPLPDTSVSFNFYRYGEKRQGQYMKSRSGGKICFAITEEDGSFTLAVPEQGSYDLIAKKAGFSMGFFPETESGSVDVLLALSEGGIIAGSVVAEDGSPVSKVRITATGETQGRPHKAELPPIHARTDEDGKYVIEGLGDEFSYTVRIVGAPSGLTALPKENVRVNPGQTTSGVDFVLGHRTGTTLSGRVVAASDGTPVHGLLVLAFRGESGHDQLDGAFTKPDGAYSLDLDIGEETVVRLTYLLKSGGSTDVETMTIDPEDSRELDFTIPKALVTIPVLFVDRSGSPLSGIGGKIEVSGERKTGSTARGTAGVRKTISRYVGSKPWISGPDGRVVFNGIGVGEEHYRVLGYDGPAEGNFGGSVPAGATYLNAVESTFGYDGHIGASEPFTIEEGEEVSEIIVVCTRNGGIEGSVANSDGVLMANAKLTIKTPLLGEDERKLTTDADGGFAQVKFLPEGVHERLVFFMKKRQENQAAVVHNVDISADSITGLGQIILTPVSEEELSELLP